MRLAWSGFLSQNQRWDDLATYWQTEIDRNPEDALALFQEHVHVARLRAALEDDPKHPRRILTVRGVGYVFAAKQDDDAGGAR